MNRSKACNYLNKSITPQSFGKAFDGIYIFDRMNNCEGRFCRIENDSVIPIFEILSGQGIVFENGDFFVIDIGQTTHISKLDFYGKKAEEISLNGTYFDFRVDGSGNYICLGNIDDATVIKIKNRNGIELKTIYPNGILFGSALYIEGDSIYLGGFDSKNGLVIIKMNYAGLIEERWIVENGFTEGVVSKIIKNRETIYILVSGKDTIISYDIENRILNKIKPGAIGLEEIIDFNLYSETIYAMDSKRIINISLEEIIYIKNRKEKVKHKGDGDLFCCAYMMYSTCIKANILRSIVPSALLSVLVIIFAKVHLIKGKNAELLSLWIYMLPFISYVFVSIGNIFSVIDKNKRVGILLKLCSGITNNNYLVMPLYNFAFIMSFFSILLYPNDGSYFTIIASSAFLLVDYCILLISKKRMEYIKNDIVVELLDECDDRIKRYVNDITNLIKEKKTEKLSISITTDKRVGQKKIDNWLESRRSVVGAGISISINEREVSTYMDLSTRNIRYSRYGIIIDYISYIIKLTDIKDIKVTVMDA